MENEDRTKNEFIKSLKGKKLLILAGSAVHCKVVEAAKSLGVYTIVTDYLETSPAKEMADEKWMLNITDVDGIVEKCRAEQVDGVLNVCIDPAQRPYQEICEKLDLPCFGNRKQFYILTDKRAFKDFCIMNGVDIIPEYKIEDIKKGNIEYPILIKPVDSRGSRGQTVCYSIETTNEAIQYAKKESSNGEVIIEKYMVGKQDFTMSYLVVDKEPYLIRTADRFLGKEEDGLNKQCIFTISPSSSTELYLNNVDYHVRQFIKKLKLKNAPIFMQGFVDEDTIRFYDPGLRFSGSDYEKMFFRATDADLVKILVGFALTGKMENVFGSIDNGYLLDNKYAIQILITTRSGRISVFDGLEEISEHPYVVNVSPRYEVGDYVPQSGDVKQRICEINMIVPHKNDIKELVKWVQSKIVVLDEEGNNMIVSQIDINLL